AAEALPMTEWDAQTYDHESALQRSMAAKSLANLTLRGDERVLDIGCGNAAVTAAIAARLPRGRVVGVDASQHMIDFAMRAFPQVAHANLAFHVADAANLPFRDEFDLIVSFNCLHWVTDQRAALRGIRTALAPDGRTHLRFVPQGARPSLEDVIEQVRRAPAWQAHFRGYQAPYVHCDPREYHLLAEATGLRVTRMDVQDEAWDFGSRAVFMHFAQATFVEWTRRIPSELHGAFIRAALDRYGGSSNVFRFYQMEVELRR
ncbi:MAG: trans-aconitate 2-methyltransferase, partial [Candidatus Binatia bacterium]